ncbi:MAG: hypothetical protein ABIK18_04350, partial [candidate division WOR-3 bacterium]
MELKLTAIPKELKSLGQWVIWRTVERNGKPTKVPLDPKTGGPAKSNDPATWASFDQAVQAAQRNGGGLGFVLFADDQFCGIDLDHSVVDGRLRLCAQELLLYFDSYAETSPSGQGIHLWLKGKLPPGGHRRTFPCGLGIEFYDRGRFFTVTGHHLPDTPTIIADRQAELEALHRQIFDTREKPQPEGPRLGPTLDLSDQELIDRAHQAADGGKFARLWAGDWRGMGYPSASEGDLALACKLAFWCGPDPARIERLFSQSALGQRPKWQNRADYRERTIREALVQATEFYSPGKGNSRSDNNRAAPGCQKTQTPSAIPAWPQEVMTGAAGRFAEVYAHYLETPPQFLYMAFLTLLGHIVCDRVFLRTELKAPTRLYTVLLGESGETRKSTAIDQTVGLFRETLEPGALNLAYGVGSAEGLAKCFKPSARLVLLCDELKTLIQKMRIDTSVLLPCINTLFESTRFHSKTKSHDIELNEAQLCLLAASTLETYRNMFNSTFLDIGFVNRLFIVIGNSERKFAIPQMIPIEAKETLKNDLAGILRRVAELSNSGPYYMPVTSEAHDTFARWYFERPDSVFSVRLDTYGHRLMVLLTVNDGKDTVTPEIAAKVVKLLDYQYQARQFADPIDADNTIARLEERIRRTLAAGPLPKRELERRCSKHRWGIWLWNRAIGNL